MDDPTSSPGLPPNELLDRAAAGDAASLGLLLEQYRSRLRRMVGLRLDPRLQGRVDTSDVIQEAFIDASRRLPDYVREPKAPFFLWLRFLTGQKLLELRRRHLGAEVRDAGREVSLYRGSMPEASSACLAAQLVGKVTAPLQAAIRAEMKLRLQEALNGMDPVDREVLALRHFEQLSNAEVAEVLNLAASGASSRYVRALKRLKEIMSTIPGMLG